MHQSWTQADAPQRSGANLVTTALKILFSKVTGHSLEDLVTVVFARGLQDTVAGAHIVHQEIAIRVQGDRAQRGGNGKRAAINFCSQRAQWSAFQHDRKRNRFSGTNLGPYSQPHCWQALYRARAPW